MTRPYFAAALSLISPIALVSAHAAQPGAPQAGQEYVSVQLASGDAQALDALYQQHAGLPYLRIERRGKVAVLRAGFWDSVKAAKAALAGAGLENPLIRSAAYKPEEILQSNWKSVPAAPVPAARLIPAVAVQPEAQPEKPAYVFVPGGAQPEPPGGIMTVANTTRTSDGRVAPGADPRLKMSSAPPENLPPPPKPAPGQAVLSQKDGQEELRPFNQDDYVLAFDIFAGAGDLRRAYLVAYKAVQSVPDDMEWRLKLARVSEWSQHPDTAWAQREFMYRRGDRSDETITALLRLAPVAPNFDIVLSVWQYRASRGQMTEAQWADLAQMFDAATKPREGSLFFEAQYRKDRKPLRLEQAARLAENGGDDERAYKLFAERMALKPFSVDLALHTVIFLLRHDRTREAYDLLQAHRNEVPPDATQYWAVLGQTAWELSEFATAEQAYRHYLTSKDATAADWSRLIALVRQRSPGEAAQLALEVFRRYRNMDYLIQAMSMRNDADDVASMGRILASLSPDETDLAERDNRFLVLRGQFYQRLNDPDRAWRDFSAAMANNETDTEVTVPAIWFLIDNHRVGELTAMLTRLEPRAQQDSTYWLPYAAAYHALDRYREALFWYGREIQRKPDDSLTLLNYADALDRYEQTGMADRVRQMVWYRLKESQPKDRPDVPLDPNPELLAFVRLALLNRPGDPALALVRDVAAQLRGLPAAHPDDRETRTLILSWAVSTEQFHNARAWMWLRYARSQAARKITSEASFDPRRADLRGAPPLWAEAQSSLQVNDTQNMDRLLERQASGLPIYNRYDTAYALDHWQQALDIAFHGLEKNPVDEELYDRFRIHAPLYNNYIQAGFSKNLYGDLNSNEQQFELRYMPFRRLQVLLDYSRAMQSSGNADYGPLAAPTDRLTSATFRWLGGEETNTTFSVFRRQEAETFWGASLMQTYRVDRRLTLNGGVEFRGNATESIPLRIAGYTNNLRFGLNYTISKREYIGLSTQYDRYYTQYNDYLGHSTRADFEAGYRIRTEYPDWRVRFIASYLGMTKDGSVSANSILRLPPSIQGQIATGDLTPVQYFLTSSSMTAGLCVGMGENLAGQNIQEIYTRAWRPFFEACETYNNVNYGGYIGQFGIAGSVLGPDHLSLRWETSRGGVGAGNFSRTLALRYRYYF